MKKNSLFLFTFILTACGATPAPISAPKATDLPRQTEAPPATFTPVCAASQLTQAKLEAVLADTADLFDATAWERTSEIKANQISIVWQNIPQSAMVFLETRFFPCGYTEAESNQKLDKPYWDTLFANYAEYKLLRQCQLDTGTRLYEFKTVNQGFNYHIRYWTTKPAAGELTATMLVFPFGSEAQLDQYALQLFPEIPYCA